MIQTRHGMAEMVAIEETGDQVVLILELIE